MKVVENFRTKTPIEDVHFGDSFVYDNEVYMSCTDEDVCNLIPCAVGESADNHAFPCRKLDECLALNLLDGRLRILKFGTKVCVRKDAAIVLTGENNG
jgi:hypothetical protein